MKCNKRQLAETLGISSETISLWMGQGCPVEHRGRGNQGSVYDVGAVFRWRIAKAEGKDREPVEIEMVRARLVQAQAEKAELELSEMRGEVVRVEDVFDEWAQLVSAAKAKILALPSKIAPRVAASGQEAYAQEVARNIVDEALNELAGDGIPKRNQTPSGNQAAMEAATEADSKSMGRPGAKAKPRGKRGAGKVGDKPG